MHALHALRLRPCILHYCRNSCKPNLACFFGLFLRQGRRQRSRPASPNSFDGLDMKDILQNLNKNPKIIRDFFKCEDVQRTLRNFQQNPKKVLKVCFMF